MVSNITHFSTLYKDEISHFWNILESGSHEAKPRGSWCCMYFSLYKKQEWGTESGGPNTNTTGQATPHPPRSGFVPIPGDLKKKGRSDGAHCTASIHEYDDSSVSDKRYISLSFTHILISIAETASLFSLSHSIFSYSKVPFFQTFSIYMYSISACLEMGWMNF